MKNKKIKKVVFIIADTLRAYNVGVYGKNPSPTPVIDKLASQGIIFENAYTTSTKTEPSITAIMSGKYPISLGLISYGKWINNKQLRNLKKTVFLAEILKSHGWETAAVAWTPNWCKRGFNYYSGKLIKNVNLQKIYHDSLFLLKFLRLLDIISIKLTRRDFFVRFCYSFLNSFPVPYDPADVVSDKALEYLKEECKGKLFLYIHFRDPHFPHVRPKSLKSYIFDSLEKKYDAEISFMDRQIGRLIDFLEKEKLNEETLIVFTADHGENLWRHNITLAHRGLYNTVVKVPLIMKHESLPVKKINEIVQTIDIFPTLLDLLGIKYARKIDGISLVPLIKGKKEKTRGYSFFEDISFGEMKIKKSHRKRGISIGDYKYIETLRGKNEDLFNAIPGGEAICKEREVYNVRKDKWEKNNLVKKLPAIANGLRMQLDSVLKELYFGARNINKS